jgi:hypothetical protein
LTSSDHTKLRPGKQDAYYYLAVTEPAEEHPAALTFNFVETEDLIGEANRDTQGIGVMLYFGGEKDEPNQCEAKSKASMLKHLIIGL